jgi:NAD(P)-dependent dehydrogenase (short-subunit alcohol dehydrogenase family)
MLRLQNKVAVITGAASGMGRATAIRFSQEGASVVVADLNVAGGESVVRECKENGGNAVFQRADISAEDQVKAMIDRAVKEFGRLDITYNNAGLGGAIGPIENITVGLGQDLRGPGARRVFGHQALSSDHAQTRRRIDHLDRLSRGSARL